jgi:hypothetical protein
MISETAKQLHSKPAAPTAIWLSVSECAKLGGVEPKTIRRALKKDLRFKIVRNRYRIDFSSLVKYLRQSTKLKNKLEKNGLGQYVAAWKI